MGENIWGSFDSAFITTCCVTNSDCVCLSGAGGGRRVETSAHKTYEKYKYPLNQRAVHNILIYRNVNRINAQLMAKDIITHAGFNILRHQ